jgi:Uma2 family endonuclease
MASGTSLISGIWTAVDLVERFGAIPLDRVLNSPPPGTATEQNVLDVHHREKRLCELIEGVLLEKTVGNYESFLAGILVEVIGGFVRKNHLGVVLPPDGMMRLAPGLIRIPDVSFISWSRLPGKTLPTEEIWNLAPDLAIEVISKSNTRQEMARKLQDYFSTGVLEVWYVYPSSQEVRVYTTPDNFTTLGRRQTLDSGAVLPGFQMNLSELFGEP